MNQGADNYLIKDPNCHYLKILPAIVTKILAHKKAEHELLSLNQFVEGELSLQPFNKKFSTLFKASPDSITISSIIDNQYKFTDLSDKFTEITGYSRAEAIGKTQ